MRIRHVFLLFYFRALAQSHQIPTGATLWGQDENETFAPSRDERSGVADTAFNLRNDAESYLNLYRAATGAALDCSLHADTRTLLTSADVHDSLKNAIAAERQNGRLTRFWS